MKQKIILASTSPRRSELASQMGLDFEIIPSNYEEDMTLNLSPKELVKALSYGKALDVAKNLNEGIVIGADTFIVFKNKKLGKPKSQEEAYKMLKSFSGKSLQVISGVALINCKSKNIIQDYDISTVKIASLSDEEIKTYISTGEPLDKAGAFAVQGLGSIFIKEVKGSYSNIVGFPVQLIYRNLKKLGVNIFEYEKWKSK